LSEIQLVQDSLIVRVAVVSSSATHHRKSAFRVKLFSRSVSRADLEQDPPRVAAPRFLDHVGEQSFSNALSLRAGAHYDVLNLPVICNSFGDNKSDWVAVLFCD